MLVGEFLEAKGPVRLVVKPLVEEAIHPLGGGIAQAHAKVIVERLQVSGLEALENHLVPDDIGRQQIKLVAGRPAIGDLIIINDMESADCPAFVRLSRHAFSYCKKTLVHCLSDK